MAAWDSTAACEARGSLRGSFSKRLQISSMVTLMDGSRPLISWSKARVFGNLETHVNSRVDRRWEVLAAGTTEARRPPLPAAAEAGLDADGDDGANADTRIEGLGRKPSDSRKDSSLCVSGAAMIDVLAPTVTSGWSKIALGSVAACICS
mmetsp:Transcript_38450/g.105928  ORF Transcript_38450/g.105928 Transcript_38450/m.105928 type:complete len:150 (+) Transcript_38450:586-1035(+)